MTVGTEAVIDAKRSIGHNGLTTAISCIFAQCPLWRNGQTLQMSLSAHTLGNLVVIGRGKNSSLSNADFPYKMERYLKSSLETIPHTLKVLNGKKAWTLNDIVFAQTAALAQIREHYLIE